MLNPVSYTHLDVYKRQVCGREIEILLNGYACKGYSQKDKDNNRVCNLYIPKTFLYHIQ